MKKQITVQVFGPVIMYWYVYVGQFHCNRPNVGRSAAFGGDTGVSIDYDLYEIWWMGFLSPTVTFVLIGVDDTDWLDKVIMGCGHSQLDTT